MNYDNGSASVGDQVIGYRLEGSGKENVVLLHGLNSHSGTWRKTIPGLVETCTVLAPSMPTHKGTVTDELAVGYSEIVRRLMENLGMNGATVVGNSMGGWVGMKLALTEGGFVKSLVLEDTAGSRSGDVGPLANLGRPVYIVWGENDEVISVDNGRSLHERIPGSEFHLMRGSGHVPHWEKPEAFNALLSRFIRGR